MHAYSYIATIQIQLILRIAPIGNEMVTMTDIFATV